MKEIRGNVKEIRGRFKETRGTVESIFWGVTCSGKLPSQKTSVSLLKYLSVDA